MRIEKSALLKEVNVRMLPTINRNTGFALKISTSDIDEVEVMFHEGALRLYDEDGDLFCRIRLIADRERDARLIRSAMVCSILRREVGGGGAFLHVIFAT